MEMAVFVVMLISGRPWTWIQKGADYRGSSERVAWGSHFWSMIRKLFTFQVTCFWILDRCSGFVSLKRYLFGPKTAKEKGTANSQALESAANTDWLLWVFWEMTCPTRGRHSSWAVSAERFAICEEGSSQERASVWAMRLSISIKPERRGLWKRKTVRKPNKRKQKGTGRGYDNKKKKRWRWKKDEWQEVSRRGGGKLRQKTQGGRGRGKKKLKEFSLEGVLSKERELEGWYFRVISSV
jgi:hypothetical protein